MDEGSTQSGRLLREAMDARLARLSAPNYDAVEAAARASRGGGRVRLRLPAAIVAAALLAAFGGGGTVVLARRHVAAMSVQRSVGIVVDGLFSSRLLEGAELSAASPARLGTRGVDRGGELFLRSFWIDSWSAL